LTDSDKPRLLCSLEELKSLTQEPQDVDEAFGNSAKNE
jgi:hypothetical protein